MKALRPTQSADQVCRVVLVCVFVRVSECMCVSVFVLFVLFPG